MAATDLADSALIVFAFNDLYRFGVLQSRVHELWSSAQGSELEDRPRYTPTTTFETFPFPRLSPHLRERYPLAANALPGRSTPLTEKEAAAMVKSVEEAAQELYEQRDRVVLAQGSKLSYTELYKENPTWLRNAHAKLDRAVLACYGLPPDATREQILEHLLAENLAREAVPEKKAKVKRIKKSEDA